MAEWQAYLNHLSGLTSFPLAWSIRPVKPSSWMETSARLFKLFMFVVLSFYVIEND